MNLYDITVLDNKGNEVSLSDYKGKVLLIVNTATGCGFTPQYEGLEALYKKYKDQGLEILDFPCNQFAGQAPGTDEEIHQFCTLKYDTSFPRCASCSQCRGRGFVCPSGVATWLITTISSDCTSESN